nr:MAG TPA: hypothetical protein [Caudoviricetes sp.]
MRFLIIICITVIRVLRIIRFWFGCSIIRIIQEIIIKV